MINPTRHEGYYHFKKQYGINSTVLFWDLLAEDMTSHSTERKSGINLDFTFDRDTTGGLEGNYSTEITGTIESDKYVYEFLVRDAFCSETILEYFELTLDKRKNKRKISDLPKAKTILLKAPVRDIEIHGTFTLEEGKLHIYTDEQPTNNCNIAETVGLKEKNMTSTTKNVATVILLDTDSNVATKDSIVAQFSDVVYTGNEQQLINNILIDRDIKGYILMHNEQVRAKTINLNILERNGIEVMLRPIEFKDLDIQIK